MKDTNDACAYLLAVAADALRHVRPLTGWVTLPRWACFRSIVTNETRTVVRIARKRWRTA